MTETKQVRTFPREMYVWDDDGDDLQKVVVLGIFPTRKEYPVIGEEEDYHNAKELDDIIMLEYLEGQQGFFDKKTKRLEYGCKSLKLADVKKIYKLKDIITGVELENGDYAISMDEIDHALELIELDGKKKIT